MKTAGGWFKDDQGRTLILRGVNLGGSSKVPFSPDGATYRREHFLEHRQVSFVGRPFPLDEADEHLERLRSWGQTFLRLLTTWEAIEHAGPGQYDQAYLEYLHAVAEKAHGHGIQVFIDPHQDVWSRFTGGDGAPGWTMEAVGMDLARMVETGAAFVHSLTGDPYPRMIWPTNYTKLGAATMFTLFFGGNDFAPRTRIDGAPAQEFLQSHYINAIKQVARALKDLPNVVGYDSLNEPSAGYIGCQDLNQPIAGYLMRGPTPTAFQTMLLAAGHAQEVPLMDLGAGGVQDLGREMVNPNGAVLWQPGHDCIWKDNGVWTDQGGTPRLLKPDHFTRGAKSVDFANTYLKPFILRFTAEIRKEDPSALLFLEGTPGQGHPHWGPEDPPQAVNAGHWYDMLTLFTKTYNPEMAVDVFARSLVTGAEAVRKSFVEQLAHFKIEARDNMGGLPTLIGEFGLPFDLDDKTAYRTGDYSKHIQALDAYYQAVDANLLNCTIWNYTADNTNERGDKWNDEDLSVFSRDQQAGGRGLDAGGRALEGFVRPYAMKISGEPLRMQYDRAARVFTFEFRPDPRITAPTEIFVPEVAYPQGYQVETSAGRFQADTKTQTLSIFDAGDRDKVSVRLSPQ